MGHYSSGDACVNTECPLYAQCDCLLGDVWKEKCEDPQLDILFVGEAPNDADFEKYRLPFTGASGMILRRAVKFAKDGRPYNVGYTNMVRCVPLGSGGETRKPTAQEINACRPELEKCIAREDPRVVVLLGQTAMSSLMVGSKTISVTRGQFRHARIAGRDRIIFATWHPSYIGRQKNVIPIWWEDIKLAFRFADGWLPEPVFAELGKSKLLKTVEEVNAYCDHLQYELTKRDLVAVDVETKNLNKVHGNKLGMIQFAAGINEACCIALDHPQTPFDPAELQQVKERLRRLFTEPVSFRYWLAHNGKFEQTIIGHHILGKTKGGTARTFSNVPMIDTMAFGYVLNENKVNLSDDGYGLKDMARNLLRFFHYDDKTLEARSKGNLLDLPLESPVPRGRPGWVPNLTDYGGMDAYVTRRLFIALKAEALQHHYYDRAIGLLEYLFSNTYRLLSRLERNGFWANLSHLNMLKDPIRSPIFLRLAEIDKVEVRKFDSAKKANAKLARKKSHGSRSLFGDPWVLDLNKPDHVRAWLIDQCKLEPVEKTESGLASVGKRFFQEYKDTVPEVALVEERRGLAKLATSYVNQLIEYIDPRYRNDSDATTRDRNEDCLDGRVRPDFWFTSTVTGRGSATNPNMQQQVRADSPEKAAIKAIFQAEQPGIQESFKIDFKKGPPKLLRPDAPPENCLVQLDFKTNEVRWWAILSGDPNLVKAFNNGKELLDQLRLDPFNADLKQRADLAGDIHKQTASQMFGVRIEDVKKDQRTGAKCLVGDTILFTGQGVLPIEQLVGDDPISIASSEGPRTATKVWKTKMSSTTCVRTQYGYELEGTPDHRVQVLAPDLSLEWRRLDSLTPDDHVVISTNNDVWPQQRVMLPEFDYDKENPTDHCHTRLIRTPKEPRVVDEALARLLGYMVSEGTCGGEAVCFSNSDALLLSDFTACYASCFGDMSATQTICNHKGDSVDRIDLRRYPSSFLRWVGIGSVLSGGQSVPDCILRSPKDVVREFLRAYFEGDGSSCSSANKTDTVRASSASRLLLRQIQMLLLNFGVVSRLYAERRPLPKSGEKRLYHILDVTAENFDLFHERIGFVTARKNTRPTQRNRYGAKIPYAKQHLHVGKGHYFGGWTPSKTITYGYLTRNLAVIGDLCKAGHEVIAGRLQNIIDNRYYFARVESVEHCEHQKPVYDVFVPDGHKFVGNGYSAHNSIVFGWMFGRGTPAIAAQIHKSVEETEKLVKMFGDTFCVGRDWLHSQPDLARRLWYVESPIGRRRRLPGYIILPSGFVGHDLKQLSQDDRRTIGECDRMAKNSVIQGVASDAAFIGGALFADYIEDNGLPWLVQNVVHDSCIYQVPITDLEESVRVAEETFTTKTMGYMHDKFGVDFPCPIEVDFDFGLTWGHLHKWDMTAPSLAAIKAELLGRTGASSTT